MIKYFAVIKFRLWFEGWNLPYWNDHFLDIECRESLIRKSVVFANKLRKNYQYFEGVFIKTINPLEFVGYEVIIANSTVAHKGHP